MIDFGASHSFIVASYVKDLGFEVETLEKPLHVSSLLRTKVRFDLICLGCELEVLGILLMGDLRVMDMSEFDVILEMDWLMAYCVVVDCDRRRVTAYAEDGIHVLFQGDRHDALPQVMYDSRWNRQLPSWLAGLTLEDEVRLDLSLPRVVWECEDVFLDELLGLPLYRDVDFMIELHPSTTLISMTLHRMMLVELQELKV